MCILAYLSITLKRCKPEFLNDIINSLSEVSSVCFKRPCDIRLGTKAALKPTTKSEYEQRSLILERSTNPQNPKLLGLLRLLTLNPEALQPKP